MAGVAEVAEVEVEVEEVMVGRSRWFPSLYEGRGAAAAEVEEEEVVVVAVAVAVVGVDVDVVLRMDALADQVAIVTPKGVMAAAEIPLESGNSRETLQELL